MWRAIREVLVRLGILGSSPAAEAVAAANVETERVRAESARRTEETDRAIDRMIAGVADRRAEIEGRAVHEASMTGRAARQVLFLLDPTTTGRIRR